ncbi:MAG: hypothetical protein OXB97_13110 [Rhodospirillales bacterium]|nr:hypothetical protein [Rhodospirillales bacterium]
MIGEGRLEALRRGVPGALYISVLVAVLWAGAGGAALAQFPDNRDLKLDPEDSVPPFYRGTLDERDRQRFDAAREAGETYLPTFQGPSTAPAAAETRAPERTQPVYEGYRRPDRRAEPAPAADTRAGDTRAGDTRAGDPRPAGAYIDVLIEAWTRQPAIVRVRYSDAAARDPGPASRGGVSGLPSGQDTRAGDPRAEDARASVPPLPRVPAGTGLYARTMYAVDSDYPGPVLLEILEPPLAGAVASGAFTLIGERLTLRLSRLEYRGRSYGVDAWAAGLDCACYGVDGEVDSHWFERVLLPASVRFAEGFLTALSRPRETVIVGDGVRYERLDSSTREAVHAGLATAARTAGDVLLENAPDGPSVRIARDTELVVVFATVPEKSGDD